MNDWREQDFEKQQISEVSRIGGGLLLVGIGIWIGARLFVGDAPLINDTGYYTNIFTEVLSVILTIGVLNYLAERREEKRRISEEKMRLIREVGSQDNAIVNKAIRELKERKWFKGESGILEGAGLWQANLSGVGLRGANLSAAGLWQANLSKASLREADLTKAKLMEANLIGAALPLTDLRGANLTHAKLNYAYIDTSKEVDEFTGKHIHTVFDEETILPDGKRWTPDTDMTKFGAFTDPEEYWSWWIMQQAEGKE